MPLPDGRTVPEPVEVASLPFSWLVGVSRGAATAAAAAATAASKEWSAAAAPLVSAVGYYDAQGADGAPAEVQVVAPAAGGTIAVITARVHRADSRSRYVFRNTRSVALPMGQAGVPDPPQEARSGAGKGAKVVGLAAVATEGVCHPNLPLLARLEGGCAVEVHSWVNGGSHLQCIPCKPRGGGGRGQPGHTAGAEPGHADKGAVIMSRSDSGCGDSSDGSGGANGRVAPVLGELAQKVRSGDELSFVPYALPSVTLACCSADENAGGDSSPDASGSSGRIEHAMWMSDWVGAEALPPALAVIDGDKRLHVFELDDGASSYGETLDANGGSTGDGLSSLVGMLGKRTPTKSSTGSLASLSNASRDLHMKDLVGQDGKERSPSPQERTSRRARVDFGGPSFRDDRPPVEKTVVLPLDSKYGLGLTLAFERSRVRRYSGGAWRIVVELWSCSPGFSVVGCVILVVGDLETLTHGHGCLVVAHVPV